MLRLRYQDAGEMADALESYLVENRFAAQEMPAFMRQLYPEENLTWHVPLSTADLAVLSSDDPGEDTEGLFVMADLESGAAPVRLRRSRRSLPRPWRSGRNWTPTSWSGDRAPGRD